MKNGSDTDRSQNKKVLDACCGSRMFYFDKNSNLVHFNDLRNISERLCDGRLLEIRPDSQYDFCHLPFSDEIFSLVIFDPPHLFNIGASSWMAKKYGKLDRNSWKDDIRNGFMECYRVLKTDGTMIFKWSEADVSEKELLSILPVRPLIGDRGRGKNTLWLVFFKNKPLVLN